MGFPLVPTFLFRLICVLRSTVCWILYWEETSDSHPAISPVFTEKILEMLPVFVFGDLAESRLGEIEDDFACAVCLGSFVKDDEIRELCNCCHVFHRKCLDHWIRHRQQTCPLCRRSLLPLMADEQHEEDENDGNGWMVDQMCYLLGQDLMVSGVQ